MSWLWLLLAFPLYAPFADFAVGLLIGVGFAPVDFVYAVRGALEEAQAVVDGTYAEELVSSFLIALTFAFVGLVLFGLSASLSLISRYLPTTLRLGIEWLLIGLAIALLGILPLVLLLLFLVPTLGSFLGLAYSGFSTWGFLGILAGAIGGAAWAVSVGAALGLVFVIFYGLVLGPLLLTPTVTFIFGFKYGLQGGRLERFGKSRLMEKGPQDREREAVLIEH